MTKERNTRRGFTLIELLVVVLIIGILAAVAVPQYQKIIWKSRTAQLRTSVSALAKAQEVFFLANGRYATKFSELDISFENFPLKPTRPQTGVAAASQDAVRANNWAEIVLNNRRSDFVISLGIFTDGPYKETGLSFVHSSEGLDHTYYCEEHIGITTGGLFCKKLMQISSPPVTKWQFRFYKL